METRNKKCSGCHWLAVRATTTVVVLVSAALVAITGSWWTLTKTSLLYNLNDSSSSSSHRRLSSSSSMKKKQNRVFAVYAYRDDSPISRKQQKDLLLQTLKEEYNDDDQRIILDPIVFLTLPEQRMYVQKHCPEALAKFEEFSEQRQQDHLAVEIWKYCALSKGPEGGGGGGSGGKVYIDSTSPLLTRLSTFLEGHLTNGRNTNIAVLGQSSYFPQTIHGSLLVITNNQVQVAQEMLNLLVQTDAFLLETSPLLLPRALYATIAWQLNHTHNDDHQDQNPPLLKLGDNDNQWYLLEQSCHLNPLLRPTSSSSSSSMASTTTTSTISWGWLDTNSYRLAHHCPEKSGFCCSILDSSPSSSEVILITRHPLLPYQTIPPYSFETSNNDKAEDTKHDPERQHGRRRPYNAEAGHYDEEELPFISTIHEQVFTKPEDFSSTPNFFDTLMRNDCLPDDDRCSRCLREKSGATCRQNSCAPVCRCYCQTLCKEPVEPKFVSKHLYVTPPLYSRDPNRLVPRIVHQTWFEKVSPEKYPNLSRLVESFRRSGWEYKFYSDDDAANFLSTHFPSQVREAYDALKPGAFKADLFRYCVLLIHGGVYADVDILLESTLDYSVAPDVGFMVPMDEPGIPVNRRMCLWNGFIAAAPGHPFLIQAIETVVNQVRNRFTAVDTDATFCPDPELSILHAFDTLFTAGPCLLGSAINRVLGRIPQSSFVAGEIAIPVDNNNKESLSSLRNNIPGRTIILSQNKWDMGAHRFTWKDRNLVVAATDLQDSSDRDNNKNNKNSDGGSGSSAASGGGEHYSKTHAKTGIYGLEGLYTDEKQANEDIRFYLDSSSWWPSFHSKSPPLLVQPKLKLEQQQQ